MLWREWKLTRRHPAAVLRQVGLAAVLAGAAVAAVRSGSPHREAVVVGAVTGPFALGVVTRGMLKMRNELTLGTGVLLLRYGRHLRDRVAAALAVEGTVNAAVALGALAAIAVALGTVPLLATATVVAAVLASTALALAAGAASFSENAYLAGFVVVLAPGQAAFDEGLGPTVAHLHPVAALTLTVRRVAEGASPPATLVATCAVQLAVAVLVTAPILERSIRWTAR